VFLNTTGIGSRNYKNKGNFLNQILKVNEMIKTLLTAGLIAAGLAAQTANASITINGVHDTASPNSIEAYYFQANASGSSDIYVSSQVATVSGIDLYMDGLLSVWTQTGNAWTLVGANDNAPRQASNSVNVYGVNVHQWVASDPLAGISDPGLTLNLTSGAHYLVIQSDNLNGPTSLSNDVNVNGALGQTIALGSNLQAALWGNYDPFGEPASGLQLNDYALTITGDVTQTSAPPAVPIPGAAWLFMSALGGFGLLKRKKTSS
jgi:hypothetical protein